MFSEEAKEEQPVDPSALAVAGDVAEDQAEEPGVADKALIRPKPKTHWTKSWMITCHRTSHYECNHFFVILHIMFLLSHLCSCRIFNSLINVGSHLSFVNVSLFFIDRGISRVIIYIVDIGSAFPCYSLSGNCLSMLFVKSSHKIALFQMLAHVALF